MASKVPVFNGDTVNRAIHYLERHFDSLERLITAVRETEQVEDYTRRKFVVNLDASGNGTLTVPIPIGWSYVLERVTVTSTGNGQCAFYVDTTNLSDLVEIIGSSQLYSDAFNNNIFVPSGSSLIVTFTAAGANGTGTVNLQIKLLKNRAHTHAPQNTYFGDA